MRDIYKLAHRIIVWLGQEKDDSAIAIEALHELAFAVVCTRVPEVRLFHANDYSVPDRPNGQFSTHMSWLQKHPPIKKPGTPQDQFEAEDSTSLDFDCPSQKASLALFNLLGRSWFTRIWTLQEVGLAKSDATVQCGNDCILWRIFRCAVFLLELFHESFCFEACERWFGLYITAALTRVGQREPWRSARFNYWETPVLR